MAPDDPRLTAGIKNLLEEYARSVRIHTDWQEYAAPACFEAVEDEFLEFRRAYLLDAHDGPHGTATEALQLAVVALKAHLYFDSSPFKVQSSGLQP